MVNPQLSNLWAGALAIMVSSAAAQCSSGTKYCESAEFQVGLSNGASQNWYLSTTEGDTAFAIGSIHPAGTWFYSRYTGGSPLPGVPINGNEVDYQLISSDITTVAFDLRVQISSTGFVLLRGDQGSTDPDASYTQVLSKAHVGDPNVIIGTPVGNSEWDSLRSCVQDRASTFQVCFQCNSATTCCAAGTYNNGGYCDPCPSGSYCAADVATACPLDSNSTPGSSVSTNCSCVAGFYGTNGGTCLACPAGFYCEGGASFTPCPSNSNSAIGASVCTCNAGYYGFGSCSLCPTGSYCEGGTNITVCPQFSNSTTGSSAVTDCQCIPGYHGTGGSCVCESIKTVESVFGSVNSKEKTRILTGTVAEGAIATQQELDSFLLSNCWVENVGHNSRCWRSSVLKLSPESFRAPRFESGLTDVIEMTKSIPQSDLNLSPGPAAAVL